jgi:flagellar basal body-associated protein FliL
MRLRNKILAVILITVGVIFSVGIGIGYYVMNQYPLLGEAFDNNPFAVLEAASRVAITQLTSTPTKVFDLDDIDRNYNKTVEFPVNWLELETAEQIVEWSVTFQSQPWVENITEFLSEYDVPVGDITLHLVFIETESGENPVMTVTYFSSNNTQIIEKGWIGRMTHNSSTVLITEEFAVDNLKHYGDSTQFVMALIQNFDGAIKLITE